MSDDKKGLEEKGKHTSRRKFVKSAAGAAIAIGVVAALPKKAKAAGSVTVEDRGGGAYDILVTLTSEQKADIDTQLEMSVPDMLIRIPDAERLNAHMNDSGEDP